MSQTLAALFEQPVEDLVESARELGLEVPRHLWIDGLIAAIMHERNKSTDTHYGCGVLEVHGEGFGFLRSPHDDLLPGPGDIYVSQSQIRRFQLRTGDTIIGRIRPPKEQERYPALLRVEMVNAEAPEVDVTPFDELTAVHPSTRLPLATDPWLSVVDWAAPVGLGQRGILVGPPRASRSEMLRRFAHTFSGSDDIEVSVFLPGARPEEVTEWRETVSVEVIATPMDEAPARHLQVADIVFERSRRLAERGTEVLLLVDSWTRLLRFCIAESSGTRLVDGLDSAAIQRIHRWIATGRDLREAGSVTMIGTLNANRSDPLSQALHRALAEAVNWQLTQVGGDFDPEARPRLDLANSWCRREDLLVFGEELERRRRWRRELPSDPEGRALALEALFRPAALDSGSGAGQ